MIIEFMTFIIFITFFVIGVAVFYFYGDPLIEKQNQELKQGDKIAQNILNKTNVSCSDIISLRLDHSRGKIDFYSSTEDQLRNIYNIKSCGTHWGWFEP